MKLRDVVWYNIASDDWNWRYATVKEVSTGTYFDVSHEVKLGFYRINPGSYPRQDLSPLAFACWLEDKEH